MFDVLGIGVAAVDDLVWVPEYPAPDTKVRVIRSATECGGLCATALVAAARLGARCAYAGVLGQDERSSFVIERLAAEGIDTTGASRIPEGGPSRSIIVIEAARGTRTVLSDSSRSVRGADDWPPDDAIRDTRVLLVDHFRIGAALRAARIARDAGIPIVADLERDDAPQFEELLGTVDHLVLSRTFAERITGIAEPGAAALALRTARRTAVVTDGAHGSWYVASDGDAMPQQQVRDADMGAASAGHAASTVEEGPADGTTARQDPDGAANGAAARHVPAYVVDVVDTTGCGDVFHGAYAAGLAFGMGVEARILLASAAAALAATKAGGQAGIPDRAAAEALIERG